jgi:hypothetical protein
VSDFAAKVKLSNKLAIAFKKNFKKIGENIYINIPTKKHEKNVFNDNFLFKIKYNGNNKIDVQ